MGRTTSASGINRANKGFATSGGLGGRLGSGLRSEVRVRGQGQDQVGFRDRGS